MIHTIAEPANPMDKLAGTCKNRLMQATTRRARVSNRISRVTLRRLASSAALVTAFLLTASCGEPPPDDLPAPLVPRLTGADAAGVVRVTTVQQLLDWGSASTPVVHVNTATDRLPNDLALTMVPVFVDWARFEAPTTDGLLRVRNVNVAGNPITGHNVLATVDVPLSGITGSEWCLSPPRTESNTDGLGGHGQLRFLFDPDERPLALDAQGDSLIGVEYLDDLIVSWEAWRPPRKRWNALEGLDPESYALTLRVYSGAKRFLDDAVRNNPWNCYPLKLPGDRQGAQTLFHTSMLMGDALARRTIRQMIDSGTIAVSTTTLDEYSSEDLEQAANVFSESELPENPVTALVGQADLSYHLVKRSCVTLSLYTVQVALERIYRNLDLGPAPQLKIAPDGMPPWTQELAHADRRELLSLLPGVFLFIARNNYVLPGNAHTTLEDHDLIKRDDDGTPIHYYYHRSTATPWGPIRDNMM